MLALSLLLLAAPLFAQRQVAITIDDLPIAGPQSDLAAVHSVNDRILRALADEKVIAIGFVNESRVRVEGETAERTRVLRQWLDSGMLLGNHTFSHPRLYDIPLERYEADVVRGEAITRPLMRERGHHRFYFRHPFTSTGKTRQDKEAFEKFLAGRHYTIAPFTVENSDFIFNALYLDALSAGDGELAARLRAEYLKYTETMFEYFEGLSKKLFGREVSQILLIHDNELHAVCLCDLLDMLKRRGYSFVSLDQALRDKAYATPDAYVGASGPSWLHRWTVALGVPFTLSGEPDPPSYVLELWRKRQRR